MLSVGLLSSDGPATLDPQSPAGCVKEGANDTHGEDLHDRFPHRRLLCWMLVGSGLTCMFLLSPAQSVSVGAVQLLSSFPMLQANMSRANIHSFRHLPEKVHRQGPELATSGARYAYVTFHGDGNHESPTSEYGIEQVLRYDLDNPSSPPLYVFSGNGGALTPTRMLRGMLITPDNHLLVAQGLQYDSCILEFGPCHADGTRTFVRELRSPVMSHPYGMTIMGDTLYVSTQDSWTIVPFPMRDLEAPASAPARKVVFDFGQSKYSDYIWHENASYRGIEHWQGCLYVSVVNQDVVLEICDGVTSFAIKGVNSPIGLLIDREAEVLYIATLGNVAIWSLKTRSFSRYLSYPGMEHPTNMAFRGKSVLVLSQTQGSLLEFDRFTGNFLRVLVSNLPQTRIEGMLLSPC